MLASNFHNSKSRIIINSFQNEGEDTSAARDFTDKYLWIVLIVTTIRSKSRGQNDQRRRTFLFMIQYELYHICVICSIKYV